MKTIKLIIYIIVLLLLLSLLNSCESGKDDQKRDLKFTESIGITIRDKSDRPISEVEVRVNDKTYFSKMNGFVEISDTHSLRGEFRISIIKNNYLPIELVANKYFFGSNRVIVLQKDFEELEAFQDSTIVLADGDINIDSTDESNIEEDQVDATEVEEPVTPSRAVIKPILNVNQTSIEIPVQGGNGSFTINNKGNGNLDWNARVSSEGAWLKLDGQTSGVNDGSLRYSYKTNYSTNKREGQILLSASGNAGGAPKTVNIKQAAYSNAQLLDIANENKANNNLEFATQIYKVITETDEEAYFNAQFELAKIFFARKSYGEAITHFTRALNTNFQLHESEIYYNRGMAYYATDQLQYAIMDFEKAIRTFGSFNQGQDELLHYNWVKALVRLARVERNSEKKKNLIRDAEAIVNKYIDNFNGINRKHTQDILEVKAELKKLNQ